MSSPQEQGHHDPKTCPEIQERLNSETAVQNILQVAQQIAPPHRGVSEFLNLDLADLAKSADLMVVEDADGLDTIFETALQARIFRQALLPNKRGRDTTIPSTQEQLRAHVKVLFKAFKCVPEDCSCQDAIKRPFRNQIHDNYLVECVCWEILEACIERSRKDANLVDAWEPGKFKYKRTSDWTFEERFDSIVETMATSKTICKHLFDVKYMLKVVDDPRTNAERVEANRKLNGLKARVMKRGKEAEAEDKRQVKRVKTEESDDEEAEDDFSPPPVKQGSRHSRQTSAAAPARTTQQPMTTPTRLPLPVFHPASAPANMSMTPPAMFRPHNSQSLQPSPLPHPHDIFDNGPYRRAIPSGMFGNVLRPQYSQAYGQTMQTPSPVPRSVMQQYPPMFAQGYATTSDVRFRPLHTTPSSRPTSSASTNHTESVTPSDQASAHGWLSQPVQDSFGINSDYSSGASTISLDPFAFSAGDNPQWTHSYDSGLGGLTDAATTFGEDSGIMTERPQGHANMADILAREEAEHTNGRGGSTESEHEEDGDYGGD
ncbi:hypothetical protein Z517_04848 [Fonsecaea pedrosoi CBS 271.37]|uniref:Uncharacterized protein n=1 Tax=Fonsecaea pedrosoi CBS 271.37 TaxID=1442368 RepID=A0A0D2F542_9EURO|nr:uncharacterized protein Z517_04848 [Fonsecaea pedrosoi CBS 271.37]KIW81822.1 hypothetical protein Z517_04848 [Fonsecaea pedrosoi CBS 271.37]